MTTHPFLASAEDSEHLRRRAMRLSYHMPSADIDWAVAVIFRADRDHDGRFTFLEYDALDMIVTKAARAAKSHRENGNG